MVYKPFTIKKHNNGGTKIMSDILGDLLVSIPESTANLQLPDPALRQFYKDEQDRIFWVDSQIDENTLDLVKMIIQCNREDKGVPIYTRKPITIMIDSPGGSVDVLLAVIKAIEEYENGE